MDRLVSQATRRGSPVAPLIIGRPVQKGSTGRDCRMFVWKVCCGSCAPALPGAIFRRRLAILDQRVPALQPMEPQGSLVADLRGGVG